MSELGLLGWAFRFMPESGQQAIEKRYESNGAVRFLLISAAIVSQIACLLLTGLLGIIIGSAFIRLLLA